VGSFGKRNRLAAEVDQLLDGWATPANVPFRGAACPEQTEGSDEESLFAGGIQRREIPRCARNDKIGAFLRKLLDFFFYDDFELGGDAVDQPDGDQGFAEDFDRLVEGDAALVDLEALRGEPLR
jgi:hypothetical protein